MHAPCGTSREQPKQKSTAGHRSGAPRSEHAQPLVKDEVVEEVLRERQYLELSDDGSMQEVVYEEKPKSQACEDMYDEQEHPPVRLPLTEPRKPQHFGASTGSVSVVFVPENIYQHTRVRELEDQTEMHSTAPVEEVI